MDGLLKAPRIEALSPLFEHILLACPLSVIVCATGYEDRRPRLKSHGSCY